jgi:hypothetical protein
LIGYFEGIDSERGIAWRAADSFALRDFLGVGLECALLDHSTISRTRRLIDLETHRAVFTWDPLESTRNAPTISCSSIFFGADSWRNVYAGEREVRPPGAPTTEPNTWERGRWANPWRQGRTDPRTRQLLHRLQALY